MVVIHERARANHCGISWDGARIEAEMETLDDDGPAEGSAERGPPTEVERRLAEAIRARRFPGLGIEPTLTSADPAPIDESVGRLGRFTVLRKLGAGGMGVVFACYDEQLERKVAVKLLRARYQSGVARLRLEREAQALARLSHPNVVQIYELGDHQGALFVAMELIVGETLSAWLWPDGREAGTGRDWRTIVAILREAGTGLAAAHAAGLVHRDFKPDNVVVGSDGRVRVLDFGLVRYTEHERPDADQPELVTADTQHDSIAALTRAGAWIGTPAYMAPEQFDALVCDAKSDQFSFCTVAFEALFGRRPFAGETVEGVAASVRRGVPASIPDDSPVPMPLRAAILRGLASDPAARWPAMAALLAELDRTLDVRRRPRRVAWAIGTAALVVAAAGLARSSVSAPRLCELDQTLLAGTWDDDRRAALRAARASHADSDSSIRVIDDALTTWATRWLASQRRACEATRVHGTQSDAMLDLRTSCLERQRREVAALVELLTHSDSAARSFELLEQLPDIAVCDDPRLAETSRPLPADPIRREHIFARYEQISRARALARTARLEQADALVELLADATVELDYLPLAIEVQGLVAERSLWRGRFSEAVPLLRAAIRAAEVAHLEELAATLRAQLATNVVGQWGRPELEAMLLEEAEIAVARLARPDDRRAAELALARAAWLDDSGDYDGALAGYEASIAAARERGELGLLARAQRQMAGLRVRLGEFEAAQQAYAAARASYTAAFGPSALFDADIELHLGLLELGRGELEAAEARFAAARVRLGRALPDDDDFVGLLELAEAKLAFMRGDLERAAQGFARVVEISIDEVRRADAWEALGVIRFYRGDMPGSLAAYREALALRLTSGGPEHPSVGVLRSNIGESLAASGDHQGALAAFAEALTILERALPPEHGDLALPYKGRGQSRLALGQRAAAVADLERALSLHERNPGEPVERADVEFTLARALDESGESSRAIDLATTAQQRLAELGHAETATTIEDWILAHD